MAPRRLIRTDTILLTAGLLLLGYLTGEVLLLVFAAVLLAVGLDGLAVAVAGRLPISRGWALVGVILGITVIIIGTLGLTATRLIQQLQVLQETMVEFVEQVQAWLTEVGALCAVI